MPFNTDEKLKGFLDTNQLARERMCLAVLAIDNRFSEVRPRHPRGGPDGGRDIEAIFKQRMKAFGAVGFVNQASDTAPQKTEIRNKFKSDLQSACSVEKNLQVFVFFTNVNLTAGEKDKLISFASSKGVIHCEIIDRELLRIALDSPDGLAARFQYLNIALSKAEQHSFFAKWGDNIQSLISSGFQSIQTTLNRLMFLEEARGVLSELFLVFELDRAYSAPEIEHFRAFCLLQLRGPKFNIAGFLFGSSDKSDRFRNPEKQRSDQRPGIKNGIGGAQWIIPIDGIREGDKENVVSMNIEEHLPLQLAGSSSSIGIDPVERIVITLTHDELVRYTEKLELLDLDGSFFILMLNRSLVEKVKYIHVYANDYKLMEMEQSMIAITSSASNYVIPSHWDEAEVQDEWVIIRPKNASDFWLNFSDQTPVRFILPREMNKPKI